MPIATQQSTETQGTWRIFGHIPGIAPGRVFKNRRECYESNVHRMPLHGISGTQEDGAYSICIAGGYKENRDEGDTIVYSGSGHGKSSDKKQQNKSGFQQDEKHRGDQEWIRGNEALRISYLTGKPVRVVRGAGNENYGKKSIYTPVHGCRYDGLYTVVDCRETKGEDGFMVCVFTLKRIPNEYVIPTTTYWVKTSHLVPKKKKKAMKVATEYPRTIKKRTAVQANAAFAERPDPAQRALKRQRKAAASSSSPAGGVYKRLLSKPSSSSRPSPAGTSSINPIVIDLTDDDVQLPPTRSASSSARPCPSPTGTKTTTQRRHADNSFTKRDEAPKRACQPLVDTTRNLALLDGDFRSLTMSDR